MPETKTVFCFKFMDEAGGGTNWYDSQQERNTAFDVCDATEKSQFSLPVPHGANHDEVTALVDSSAWEQGKGPTAYQGK